MQVVQYEYVEATVKTACDRPDVRCDRLRRIRRQGTINGKVHQRKHRGRSRLAVFEYLEIVLHQVFDDVPAFIGDDCVNFDEIDVGFERHAWLLSGACGGWRLRAGNAH